MNRLEAIVRQLEDGSVPLEESMKLFREGTALVSGCNQMLDEAALEIVKLTEDPDGSVQEEPLIHEDIE